MSTKTIVELLAYLREHGILLWVDGDQLRYNAPKGALSPNLRLELSNRKAEITAFLNRSQNITPTEAPAKLYRETGSEMTFATPTTSTEMVLADLWSQVLKIEPVGIHNNFFELGGDSLLAMQIVTRANQIGLSITPVQLFEHQTIAELGTEIDTNRDLPHIEKIYIPPISPIEGRVGLPLSFAQQRLWILDQIDPEGATAYTIPTARWLRGPLNVDILIQALTELVRRHEILRMTVKLRGDQPVQEITELASFPLAVVDLQGLPENQHEAHARQLIVEEVQRPFDLAAGPLFRAKLFKLKDAEHILLLTMHHILSDGWSVDILRRELIILYNAFLHGDPYPLAELPIKYADYSVWQRQWLQGEVLETQLAYWKEQLGGALPVLELPADHPRLPVQTFRGARQAFSFPDRLSDQLKALSQHEGVTLFMLLLAGFQTLLYRYTGQDDFFLGTPIAGRMSAEVEGLIGLFVNTLVLRADLNGDPSFVEVLQRTRQRTLGAFLHQYFPFEQLVDLLQPKRDMSHSPLFQIMFAFQNLPKDDLNEVQWSGLTQSSFTAIDSKTSMFDLTLFVWDSRHGIHGVAEYNSDLFTGSTIISLLERFQVLLEGIVANPNQRLRDLPWLTETEKRQVLVEWNETQTDFPQDICLHELFESQVSRTPDLLAVVFENQTLTYQALNQKANQLARYLQKLGVGLDTLVGICVERSLEMVVGVLGILKAGGAYVPLDPTYPPQRIKFILSQVAMPVLLTQQHLAEGLPAQACQVVCLDANWDRISQERSDNLMNQGTPANIAYVIYTSGSTGAPKGVQIQHLSIVNVLSSIQPMLQLSHKDILLSVTSLSFDIAVVEIFLPLILGARVIVANRDDRIDNDQLRSLIATAGVTVMQGTPSTWHMLLQSGWGGLPNKLKILCAGEVLSHQLATQLMDGGCELWNLYGPTETTIYSTAYMVQPGDSPVPIGRPIGNTQIYLLDADLQPVPVGVTGELYIGGVGLARGYLNRPDLTAERFLPDPFAQTPGSRIYKTGDLARWLPNSHIEFIGRLDHQVKIRGYRIELGEIEAALTQHPAVKACVALARQDSSGDKRLVAYISPIPHPTPTTKELRDFLKVSLPEYMLPVAFVCLETLPLTPNGKIDRNALPSPEEPAATTNYIAPRSSVEMVLADIWSEVLHLKQVSISDNFFELGGNSLLAVQVRSRVQNAFEIKFPLRTLFERPTIIESAEVVEEKLIEEIEQLSEEEAQRLAEE